MPAQVKWGFSETVSYVTLGRRLRQHVYAPIYSSGTMSDSSVRDHLTAFGVGEDSHVSCRPLLLIAEQ
jgi:hypothetical protein